MISRSEELLLIGRVVAFDDRRAFGRLVDAYAPPLRSYLYNLCGCDADLAADISQETFIKVYQSLKQFKAMSSFKTWLYRIAYNEFINQRRRITEPPCTVSQFNNYASTAAPEPGAYRLSEMRHDIEVALRQLSAKERSLVLLFYYNDLPVKDIAKVMAMPEGTVKVYLSRAKSKMAQALK